MKTPVLMYHEITNRAVTEIPVEERPYAITSDTFDQQLEYLDQQGIVSRLIEAEQPADRKSVVITFDDGFASDAAAALLTEFMRRTLHEVQDRGVELVQAVRTADGASRRTGRALAK